MIKIIWNAFLLAIIALSAAWLSGNPGAVRIRWIGYEAETSVAVILACALTVYIVFYFFLAKPVLLLKSKLSYWAGGDRRAQRLARGKIHREVDRYTLLGNGLTAVAAGDIAAARKMRKSIDKAFADDPEKTIVFKAQLAEAENDAPEALRLYKELAASDETRVFGIRGQIRLYARSGETRKALDLCEILLTDKKPYRGLLSESFALYVQERNRTGALDTLDRALRENVVDKKTFRRVKASVMLEAAKDQTDADERRSLIFAAEDADDTMVPAVLAAADVLAREGAPKKAIARLKKLWRTAPEERVFELYESLLPDKSPDAVLKAAQELTGENKEADANDFVLAKALLTAGKNEQAREAVEKYLEKQPSSEKALRLAAAACAALGDEETAADYEKRAVELSVFPQPQSESAVLRI